MDSDGSGLIEENELTEYLKHTHMPGITTGGKVLPPDRKSRQLIRKICCNGGTSNAISLSDLKEFYIDRGVFTTDDVMFKYEILDDWLFSEELCDKYLSSEAPHAVPSTTPEYSALKRGNSMSKATMKCSIEMKRSDSMDSISSATLLNNKNNASQDNTHNDSTHNDIVVDSPRLSNTVNNVAVDSSLRQSPSPPNRSPRSRDTSVRARVGTVPSSSADEFIENPNNNYPENPSNGCDKIATATGCTVF